MKTIKRKQHSQVVLDYEALERENLRLQREIGKLKAQLVSTRNELLLRPTYHEPLSVVANVDHLNRLFSSLPEGLESKPAIAPQ